MKINTEAEMLEFGMELAKGLELPAVIELVGDVGAGKTTLTRGLAQGLGISEPITSPSFTISKRYIFQRDDKSGELVHYDFYRLDDPGIMREELAETLDQPNSVVVVEWGDSISNLLPSHTICLHITLNPDDSRTINISSPSQPS